MVDPRSSSSSSAKPGTNKSDDANRLLFSSLNPSAVSSYEYRFRQTFIGELGEVGRAVLRSTESKAVLDILQKFEIIHNSEELPASTAALFNLRSSPREGEPLFSSLHICPPLFHSKVLPPLQVIGMMKEEEVGRKKLFWALAPRAKSVREGERETVTRRRENQIINPSHFCSSLSRDSLPMLPFFLNVASSSPSPHAFLPHPPNQPTLFWRRGDK